MARICRHVYNTSGRARFDSIDFAGIVERAFGGGPDARLVQVIAAAAWKA